jgi:hypothetical protein
MKLIFTGSDGFTKIGWNFTRGKTYEAHQYEKSVYYVISDNDKRYYINIGNSTRTFIHNGKLHHTDTSLELVDSLDSNFMSLQKWRDSQIEKVINE